MGQHSLMSVDDHLKVEVSETVRFKNEANFAGLFARVCMC